MALKIKRLFAYCLFVTLVINGTQHKTLLYQVTFVIIGTQHKMLLDISSAIVLSVNYCYVDCRYAKCCCAERRGTSVAASCC